MCLGEAAKSLFKERTAKLNQRLELMNKRYQALERRRSLEVEGYKNDIRLLRQKMKDLEKKLYKARTESWADEEIMILISSKGYNYNGYRFLKWN